MDQDLGRLEVVALDPVDLQTVHFKDLLLDPRIHVSTTITILEYHLYCPLDREMVIPVLLRTVLMTQDSQI